MHNKWVTLKNFIPQNKMFASEHCFHVTLAGFEQIINNDFIQLEAEWLNVWNKFEIILRNFFKSLY